MKAALLFLCSFMMFQNDIDFEIEHNHCVPLEEVVEQKASFKVVKTEKGLASWYGNENKVASDGKKIEHKMPSIAHRSLPLGTQVKVTCVKTNKSVIAVVVDRGPYIRGRIADLNIPAAKKIGILTKGLATILLEVIQPTEDIIPS